MLRPPPQNHALLHAGLHKWATLGTSELCDCGVEQNVYHTVDPWPVTPFDGSLLKLHKLDDDAVNSG